MMRIMIIDEFPLICMGLSHIVKQQSDMTPVGSCSQMSQAIDTFKTLSPDTTVIDVSPLRQNCIGIIKALKEICSTTRIVAMSSCDKSEYIKDILNAGADGYVLKQSSPDKIVDAIRATSNGQTYLDARLVTAFIGSALNDSKLLSQRELECLRLLAEGYGMKEVARMMGVSIKTVDTYKRRSFDKLGFRSRVDLLKYAAGNGWLNAAAE